MNLSFGPLSKGVLRPGPNRWRSTARAATGEVTQALQWQGMDEMRKGFPSEQLESQDDLSHQELDPISKTADMMNKATRRLNHQKKEFAHNKHGRLGTCSIELVGDFKHFEDILAALLDGR